MNDSRYEKIMLRMGEGGGRWERAYAVASFAARAGHPVACDHDAAIRDVAAGVAGPALIGYVLWILRRAHELGLSRLRFLSRDGQVLYLLAQRITQRTGHAIDLEYVYSSRITWSLAATDPERLPEHDWLFSSFMKANASDLCARLGLDPGEFRGALVDSGVSLNPHARADRPSQLAALRQFLSRKDVVAAVEPRIVGARSLLVDYAREHMLGDAATGLVDAGWTGRMVGSPVRVAEDAGMARPHIFSWGHEPRPDGWTDPHRLSAFIYNTARGEGLQRRVPDAPFIVETSCMGDHGIVAGYEREPDGSVGAKLRSASNSGPDDWGLALYRSTLLATADELDLDSVGGDARPLIHTLMAAFWLHPSPSEARAWGGYPYDSDPTGTAARALARPFTLGDILAAVPRGSVARSDRAWLPGSLALTRVPVRLAARPLLGRKDIQGAPPSARDVRPA